MTLMIAAITLIILSTGGFIYYQERQEGPSATDKSAALKKEEIINGYKAEMDALLMEHQGDGMRCLSEKRRTLHRINRELATNIFFDQDEVKNVLTTLASYERAKA